MTASPSIYCTSGNALSAVCCGIKWLTKIAFLLASFLENHVALNMSICASQCNNN